LALRQMARAAVAFAGTMRASSNVRAMGAARRAATIARATRREWRSSPRP